MHTYEHFSPSTFMALGQQSRPLLVPDLLKSRRGYGPLPCQSGFRGTVQKAGADSIGRDAPLGTNEICPQVWLDSGFEARHR